MHKPSEESASGLESIRCQIRQARLAKQYEVIQALVASSSPTDTERNNTVVTATTLVKSIRESGQIGLMEIFLAEYGLSSDEGVALMCLAEALLRVPDDDTIDDLIEDKISPSSWGEHLGRSSSSLVNASTWALMLTGKVLNDDESTGIAGTLRTAIKRVGEPVIRAAVKRAMKELGAQFVLGETIDQAIEEGGAARKVGFRFSYDMLGEAAVTAKDALEFFDAYQQAIGSLAPHCRADDIRDNPGISIKLSALHPRYEVAQKETVLVELVARAKSLAMMAKSAGMGLNIDAEEADRLDLSLDIIEALLRDNDLAGWDGFGVVVQAYGKRCAGVIDWLYALSVELDRNIMVRLVKGAYWDSEIKHAQVEGMRDFPVFTHKTTTDISYICCAKKLLGMTDRIFPQFATHNAHTVSAILEMASADQPFEFQRLHGMGEALHDILLKQYSKRCRIYAPVGPHRDLLAYLVRRLLENGANSSFVNQIVDESVEPADICADPFLSLDLAATSNADSSQFSPIRVSANLYFPDRKNSRGWDLTDDADIHDIEGARGEFKHSRWQVGCLIPATNDTLSGSTTESIEDTLRNPANPEDIVGTVTLATEEDVDNAMLSATPWNTISAAARAAILVKASDLFELHYGELFAVLCREAGKTPADSIAELREAVDFLRYYANEAGRHSESAPRGVFVCISPWNFPLAIFTGQIAAALAAGNGVIAKPAEATPIVAYLATQLMHKAGVPPSSLQLLPGLGSVVGNRLTSNKRCDGVCFTGSTTTALLINKAMALAAPVDAPLIAETGGLNTMIVDSTALPEQAVKDIVVSAFQSAGQRCSALRILCLQEDIADGFLNMLTGAMDELVLGNPWEFATDVGPVVSQLAQREIGNYISTARESGNLRKLLPVPSTGHFIGPALIKIRKIGDVDKEIFGPVLHYLTFRADEINQLIKDINSTGFGLTFGLHTRIDDRVEQITSQLNVGNMYINRNQIGAIVGSQPFGGEGLSGTGPKAGGSYYLPRFLQAAETRHSKVDAALVSRSAAQSGITNLPALQRRCLHSEELPGPTGESNRLRLFPRGVVLCLGPSLQDAQYQAAMAQEQGCPTLCIAPGCVGEHEIDGILKRKDLAALTGISAVVLWSDEADLRAARTALAARAGAIVPLITHSDMQHRCIVERHVCIDTTAAGGNASLLASNA